MRGFFVIGTLIALVTVGYLQVNSAQNTARQYDAESVRDLPRQVENEINAATDQHMKKLKQADDRQ